jgi:predicted nucleic acid-binding protein
VVAFADSSALVKLYADEEGCELIRPIGALAVSQIARVEVPAALWRKQRMGELSAGQVGLLAADFEADYFGTEDEQPRFAAVMTTGVIFDEAARLCATHGLRAYDAVQLASGLAARDADSSCTTFAAVDHPLRTAAAMEGFALLPATE